MIVHRQESMKARQLLSLDEALPRPVNAAVIAPKLFSNAFNS